MNEQHSARPTEDVFSNLGPLPQLELTRAHDVRHLRPCAGCDEIYDRRSMIFSNQKYWHGRCFGVRFGLHVMLDMPKEETDKLTIGDIGPEAMKELLEHRYD